MDSLVEEKDIYIELLPFSRLESDSLFASSTHSNLLTGEV